MTDVLRSDFSRVWLIESRAGPVATPRFMGLWKAGKPTHNMGNSTRVRQPDPNQYGAFETIDIIPGDPDLPEIPITAYYEISNLSTLLRLTEATCENDIQIHMGACKNPQDFNRGWQKILVLEGGRINKWTTTDDIGALDPKQRAAVQEEGSFQGLNLYELKPLIVSETGQTAITREILDAAICDGPNCGIDCGTPSDGCQMVYLLSVAAGGSPGASADIVFTKDSGGTWSKTHVQSLGVATNPNALACVGTNLVVVSATDEALHYAPLQDIQDAVETWTKVTSGFVATHGPTAIYAASPNAVFITGLLGYIYYTTDPTNGVTAQTAGDITVQTLNAIKGLDDQHVVAVGNSNTVLATHDGGTTWTSITGPAIGTALIAVEMQTADIWWAGNDAGKLFYTRDSGAHWAERAFSGSGSGKVRDVIFVNRTVGYMVHSTSAPKGRAFRTLDGGGHWYLLPEGTGTIPANNYMATVVACNPNTFFAAGLASNGTDGFAAKSA